MGRDLRTYSKTSSTPRRPFEKERLDQELKLVGEYGLKNKNEVWRVKLALAKIRKVARTLLTLDPKDPKRIFEGGALLRKLNRLGMLAENEQRLEYVLGLVAEKMLDRRLQTRVYESGMAKSYHHARVLIRQRHIRVGKTMVNVPSFLVHVDSDKHIDFHAASSLGGGRDGRRRRKTIREGGDESD